MYGERPRKRNGVTNEDLEETTKKEKKDCRFEFTLDSTLGLRFKRLEKKKKKSRCKGETEGGRGTEILGTDATSESLNIYRSRNNRLKI